MRELLLRLLDHRRAARTIVGLGVLVRVVALALLARTPLDGDAGSYHETALGLLGVRPFEPHWPPGMPLLLLPAYALFGPEVVVGRAVMIPVYLAFCVAVRALARRIAGDRAANVALLIFAVTPISSGSRSTRSPTSPRPRSSSAPSTSPTAASTAAPAPASATPASSGSASRACSSRGRRTRWSSARCRSTSRGG